MRGLYGWLPHARDQWEDVERSRERWCQMHMPARHPSRSTTGRQSARGRICCYGIKTGLSLGLLYSTHGEREGAELELPGEGAQDVVGGQQVREHGARQRQRRRAVGLRQRHVRFRVLRRRGVIGGVGGSAARSSTGSSVRGQQLGGADGGQLVVAAVTGVAVVLLNAVRQRAAPAAAAAAAPAAPRAGGGTLVARPGAPAAAPAAAAPPAAPPATAAGRAEGGVGRLLLGAVAALAFFVLLVLLALVALLAFARLPLARLGAVVVVFIPALAFARRLLLLGSVLGRLGLAALVLLRAGPFGGIRALVRPVANRSGVNMAHKHMAIPALRPANYFWAHRSRGKVVSTGSQL